jgi:hypothetical protein
VDPDDPIEDKKIGILDIFEGMYEDTTSAAKMQCIDCGLQGGRTSGFILFKDNDTAFCHSSGKWFKLLEAYALKKKIIRCIEGRESGDTKSKILGGELYTATLEAFKEEYGCMKYEQLCEQLNIKKEVKLPGNNRLVSRFCDDLADIYKSRNALFFRPESRDIIEIGKIRQADNKIIESGFVIITANRFVTLVEMLVNPWTVIPAKGGLLEKVYRSMNITTSCQVIESPNFQNKLPVISRIFDIQIPIIHKEKLVFPKRGYDIRFNSWVPFNAPQINSEITLEEAKEVIEFMLKEFPFRTPLDKTYAIAGLITPFLRGLFPTFSTRTPVFIYMANRERTGKDYLAGVSGMIYEGVHIQETPICTTDQRGGESEELRKKITSAIKEGRKRFHSSNNKGVLNNSLFENITTSEDYHDRLLGTNKTVTYKNEIDFSLSGNIGLKVTPDTVNRGRVVNLHLAEENANARKFQNPYLHEWILENRGLVISCLYALVRNWHKKNCPKGTIPFASFPRWSEICGGIMESAGYGNPCETQDEAFTSLDSETEEMKYLFENVYKAYPDQWILKNDISEVVRNDPDIMGYYNFDDKGDQTKFGMRIDKFIDREMSGITMTVDSLKTRAARRKYKFSMKKINKNQENEVGNPGNPEVLSQPVPYIQIHTDNKSNSIYQTDIGYQGIQGYQNTDDKTSMATPGNRGNLETQKHVISDKYRITQNDQKIDVHTTISTQGLPNIDKIVEKFKKSEEKLKEKGRKIKEKSDRELQYYESPECNEIIEKCSKEDVLNWVKNNPNISFEVLYEKLGDGSLKHLNDLVMNGMVKRTSEGWEVV